jgi:Mannosyl-glycoprotein endo-beta-N-acetylglucosaminidase
MTIMTEKKIILPILTYRGQPIRVGFRGRVAFWELGDGTRMYILDGKPLVAVIALFGTLLFWPEKSALDSQFPSLVTQIVDSDELPADEETTFKQVAFEGTRAQFIREKQKLIYEYTVRYNVSRVDQLSDIRLLELNRAICDLFVALVLDNLPVENHVYLFFTDTTDLDKLETALMEQAKYQVPASIKLAQSALETAYGRRVINNNYFGIKDKSSSSPETVTTEYFSEAEARAYQHKIISKKKMRLDGKVIYKCVVKDHFSRYQTPWESFRAHSLFLSTNNRYAPLFTGGKKYDAWADKIGSVKQGGVGYATSPIYGVLLKKIIRRYHLDLLDY